MIKLTFTLFRWGVRLWAVLTWFFTEDPLLVETITFVLAVEFIASVISLLRFTADDIIEVVTGFDGLGDTGFYEFTDNGFFRFLGILSWIVSILFRVLLILIL